MRSDADHYAAYYADKIWNLLPEVYRAEDSADEGVGGPLAELVARLGEQVAVIRRSLDRLWEDQSPETCDAWAVAYLGDLLAANLLPEMDARARRVHVAKTIYYRRRKGTVAVLEELAADLTGWHVKVVEFFRQLGRTRHNFDPSVGEGPRALRVAQGLIGRRSSTPAGGLADLRDAACAASVGTAFDEFAHAADFRRGAGTIGWYGIPRLGVFLWRLVSFRVGPVTPVQFAGKPECFTFDPTGRALPLFALGREDDSFAGWTTADEWDVPGPISQPLWDAVEDPTVRVEARTSIRPRLFPRSVAVYRPDVLPGQFVPVPLADLTVWPPFGRFRLTGNANKIAAAHCYGFPAEIGAGPYDRRPYQLDGFGLADRVLSGGADITTLPETGVVEIADSLTSKKADAANATKLTIRAANAQRPLARLAADWVFTGTGEDATLDLDGVFVSGTAVVLAGTFATVTLRCCTFDPGSADAAGGFAKAADDSELTPTALRVKGTVNALVVARCILGPVRITGNGRVSNFTATDSIVQSLDGQAAIDLAAADVSLTRCTVAGDLKCRRIEASECVLAGVSVAADTQSGCVRFSAWRTGSALPRKFESVELHQGAEVFASTRFGDPNYYSLAPGADAAALDPTARSMRDGAENGSEMGAFASVGSPLKRRGLLAKFREYLPAGLVPVLIDVT